MLELRGLTIGRLVHGVDLEVRPGELVLLLGPSGAGKSLILRALLGMCKVEGGITAGELYLDGARWPLPGPPSPALALVPQHAHRALDPLRRVRQQLADPAAKLAAVGLPGAVAEAFPHQLSGGMATRVAVAMALADQRRYLLADEPTAGLDPAAAAGIARLLRDAAAGGRGVLWVTHDLRLALPRADRAVVVADGRVVDAVPSPFEGWTHPIARALVAR